MLSGLFLKTPPGTRLTTLRSNKRDGAEVKI
jgi:hypothetical protein